MTLKTDWIDGNILHADDLNENVKISFGKGFGIYSQLIFNSALEGFNKNLNMIGGLDIDNLEYEIDRYSTSGMQTNWGDIAYNCQATSVDTDIWSSTGGLSATGGGLCLRADDDNQSYTATANGTNSVPITTGTYFLEYSMDCYKDSSSPPDMESALCIKDAAGTVLELASYDSREKNNDVIAPTNVLVRLNIDKSTNKYTLTTDLSVTTASTSTGLDSGQTWYLHLLSYVDGTVNNFFSYISLYQWTYFPESYEFIKDFGVTPEITNCVLSCGENIEDGTISYSVSSDGTNYEEVELNKIHEFTNIGTNLKVKMSCEPTSAGDVTATPHIAVFYNI
jgi:hypothetical protein